MADFATATHIKGTGPCLECGRIFTGIFPRSQLLYPPQWCPTCKPIVAARKARDTQAAKARLQANAARPSGADPGSSGLAAGIDRE
jgi:hypothetical protein